MEVSKKRVKTRKEKAILTHHYYARTGFYLFVWDAIKKAIGPIITLLVALILVNKYVININEALQTITETFTRLGVLATFFASETLLGLIPPEIFIAWTKKTTAPIMNLAYLAVLSYSGGIIGYFVGRNVISKIPAVQEYLEVKMAKNLKNTRKWGGILIVVGASLPLPFSIACITSGMIKYPFKNVAFLGLFRLLRFVVYALVIFRVVT